MKKPSLEREVVYATFSEFSLQEMAQGRYVNVLNAIYHFRRFCLLINYGFQGAFLGPFPPLPPTALSLHSTDREKPGRRSP